MEYEEGLSAFTELKKEILQYDLPLSEADTRCKIVDKFLTSCLGWNENDIRREEHVNEGYIDYIMRFGNKGLIVEAKKIGAIFELPAGLDFSSRLTIGNLLKKEKTLEIYYDQVSRYCLNASVQFGCFTNGLAWVIFPAVRTDGIKLHMSKVIVFNGIKEIGENFISFWNLLSKKAMESGTINEILLPELKITPPSFLVNDQIRRDQVLNRNKLSGVLSPILPEYFGDLIGLESINTLEKCYVEPTPLSEVTGDRRRLSKTVGEAPPIRQYLSPDQVYADLDKSILAFINSSGRSGVLYVLLGRVGSGKSTFLYHYFYVKNKSIHDHNLVFFLNWLEYDEQQSISDFFYEKIEMLSKSNTLYTENAVFKILERAFQEDITTLKKGALGNIKDEAIIQQKVSELLIELSNRKEYFYSRLFKYLRKNKGINTIIIFDNIDQLDPKLQDTIIKFSYAVYERWGSFTLISLREENYVKSKREGSLSTIQCNLIYIPKPSIIPIIKKRLECFADDIADDSSKISSDLTQLSLTALDLRQYIFLISKSITSYQDKVKNFLEALAFGNIRQCLEFFRKFLTAGNTN